MRQNGKIVIQHCMLKNKGRVQMEEILLKTPSLLSEKKFPRQLESTTERGDKPPLKAFRI